MPWLRVDIVRFVDEHQPGFVACEFTDASGKLHGLEDKAPVFSVQNLSADSEYPQPGHAHCEVLGNLKDTAGLDLARITIAKPDGLETGDGETEFIVLSSQLTDPPGLTPNF